MRRGATKREMHSDPPAHPFWQRFAPSRLFSGQIQHAKMSSLLPQQFAPELVWIPLCQAGELVNETLGCKRSVRVADRTQPLHRDINVRLVIFDRHVRD